MLSHKLQSLEKLLELAATAQVMPTQTVMRIALRNVRDCKLQALDLESRIIPRRQRLEEHHLADGKVAMFPIGAAPEAQL